MKHSQPYLTHDTTQKQSPTSGPVSGPGRPQPSGDAIFVFETRPRSDARVRPHQPVTPGLAARSPRPSAPTIWLNTKQVSIQAWILLGDMTHCFLNRRLAETMSEVRLHLARLTRVKANPMTWANRRWLLAWAQRASTFNRKLATSSFRFEP